jgi:pimeloyl-ACP methyl ester carboxylesterase
VPYGAGREWAFLLPNARLVTIGNAGYAPWIESADTVFGSVKTFFGGKWPETAKKLESLDAQD